METRRRSATGAIACAGAAGAAAPTSWSGVPHSPQNFSLPVTAAPHAGQDRASGVPHSVQNFLPSGFSVAQFGQRIAALQE